MTPVISSTAQVQMIQKVKAEIPGAQDFFELSASRLRARRDISFKRTIRVLREHGTTITKEQMHTICHSLEKAGVGKILPGGKSKDPHFELYYDLISVARVALGEAKQLDPAPKAKYNLPDLQGLAASVAADPTPVSIKAQVATAAPKTIKVRCGSFELDVPLDMDSAERERASQLIASLPQLPKA